MPSRHESKRDDRLVYDVPEAGALLGLSRNASYEAAKRGQLPTIKVGKLLKVPKAALMRLLEQAGITKGGTAS
ncbi:helix-turn-helix domain-containing protein [Bradyrhizobium erythrophlei]|jgi:excisionase family DNA binding protein|uniref:DNA binding domain-containing protein, excisionase family n=1 Tax=Bradyrhizobium erythrophlei TaxID=1437360 RepID=A0A1M5QI68_9BRAD|nr:helix-turn-helix domain-containing protein [Bradyrhizobium erythrophlei]SHH13183.1 DNA binding domain-containing protein, excisionase family [Bradyrhizobium erythrophlei]